MAPSGPSADGSHPHAPQSVNGWQPDFVEALYAEFKADPASVAPEWRQFFLGFELGLSTEGTAPAAGTPAPAPAAAPRAGGLDPDQRKVDELILRYRTYGHLAAQLDPLGTTRPFPDDLTLEAVGLGDDALARAFDPGTLPLDNPSPLAEIVACLEATYCGPIGVEYMHIRSVERRAWLAKRLEAARSRPALGAEVKRRLLAKLMEAESFETFLANRYVGKKRFGLEGGESLIPILDTIVEAGPALGVAEFMFGMAHRGRLNVLANIVGKDLARIFTEFDEAWTAAFA